MTPVPTSLHLNYLPGCPTHLNNSAGAQISCLPNDITKSGCGLPVIGAAWLQMLEPAAGANCWEQTVLAGRSSDEWNS